MIARWGTHKPVWDEGKSSSRYPPLVSKTKVDVAVIGGGITGLTAALLLKARGLKVAVLTKNKVGNGATGHSTGHLTSILDISFSHLIGNFGKTKAGRVLESTQAAIAKIENLSQAYQINCDFKRIPGFRFTEDMGQREQLEEEISLATDLGLSVARVRDLPIPIKIAGAARFANQAQFNPLAYIQGLAEAIHGEGSSVFEETPVLQIDDGEPCTIYTRDQVLVADKIFMATHTPIGNYFSLHTRVAPYFSYVLGVQMKQNFGDGLFWDMNTPYNYLRKTSQGLWIIGGQDHKTGQEENTFDRYLALEEYVRNRFEVADICYYWGEEAFESVDGLPFIGKIPFLTSVYTATGFAGMGLTFGTLAGMCITDQITQQRSPWDDLYDPSRFKPLASASKFTGENANSARRYLADRFDFHRDSSSHEIDQIPIGEGKIIDVEGRKIAAYRDVELGICTLSPVCGHLGGIVHWNTAEKTWDCPCHGSRYTPKGEVLEGPSLRGLDSEMVDLSDTSSLRRKEAETSFGFNLVPEV